jgi:hypothetical protein
VLNSPAIKIYKFFVDQDTQVLVEAGRGKLAVDLHPSHRVPAHSGT